MDDPQAWLTYEDGPLALVLEVASDVTRHKELDKRDQIYARTLNVPEYIYVNRDPGGAAARAPGGVALCAGRAPDAREHLLEPGV